MREGLVRICWVMEEFHSKDWTIDFFSYPHVSHPTTHLLTTDIPTNEDCLKILQSKLGDAAALFDEDVWNKIQGLSTGKYKCNKNGPIDDHQL